MSRVDELENLIIKESTIIKVNNKPALVIKKKDFKLLATTIYASEIKVKEI